jgi:hypothetical protein
VNLEQLVTCVAQPLGVRPEPLIDTAEKLARAGGAPFEVAAGVPAREHGVRLSFRTTGDPGHLAAAAGLGEHPWGAPDWVSARLHPDERVTVKGYHRASQHMNRLLSHRGLPPGVTPVMFALVPGRPGEADDIEVYAQHHGSIPWSRFVAACVSSAATPQWRPYPRPEPGQFGVSVRHRGERLVATTVYAYADALPEDGRLRAEWCADLAADDLAFYEAASAAVRSVGRPPWRGWHAAVSWTHDGEGWRRAVCLRVPPLN